MNTAKNPTEVKQLRPVYATVIEQKFPEKPYAYTAVNTEDGAGLGVAVVNERGYWPIPTYWFVVPKYDDAAAEADRLNKEVLGLDYKMAAKIVMSSMRG